MNLESIAREAWGKVKGEADPDFDACAPEFKTNLFGRTRGVVDTGVTVTQIAPNTDHGVFGAFEEIVLALRSASAPEPEPEPETPDSGAKIDPTLETKIDDYPPSDEIAGSTPETETPETEVAEPESTEVVAEVGEEPATADEETPAKKTAGRKKK